MRRALRVMVIGLVGAVVAVSSASAQSPYVFLGGGGTFPMGHFKTSDEGKTGWAVQAGVGYDLSKGAWVEAEGWYGSNKREGGTLDLLGGLAAVGYSFTPDKKVSPYVLAGAGIISGKTKPTGGGASDTESKFAYSGAAGIGFNSSESVHFWLEGRYLGAKDFALIPVSVGVTLTLGKKK